MPEMMQRSEQLDDRAEAVPQDDTIVLDIQHGLALIRGQLVHLSPKQCALIDLLGRSRDVVLTKYQLLEHLYPQASGPQPTDQIIDVFVARLLKRFAMVGMTDLSLTVWRGRGYRSSHRVSHARLTVPHASVSRSENSSVGTTDATSPETGDRNSIGVEVAKRLAEATRQAIQLAHTRGLAVPVRREGAAVELRPDGRTAPIDDLERWHPTDWKSKPVS